MKIYLLVKWLLIENYKVEDSTKSNINPWELKIHPTLARDQKQILDANDIPTS